MTKVAVKKTKESGLKLILDPKSIEKPNFPVKWAFGDEMLTRIRNGLAKGHGYAVLIVATLEGDWQRHFELREVNEYQQYFRLLEVPRPGNWTIGIVLFERTQLADGGARTTDSLCRYITANILEKCHKWKKSLDYRKYSRNLHTIPDVPPSFFTISESGWSELGVGIATDFVTVPISKDLFPADPPKALSDFGNYFFDGRMPYDQCFFVWRLVGMGIFGTIPWFLIELTKRTGLFGCAMVMLLFGISDWWKVGDRALEPAVNVALMVEDSGPERTDTFNGFLFFVTPGMLALYALAFSILKWSVEKVSPMVSISLEKAQAPDPSFFWVIIGIGLAALIHLNRAHILNAIQKWWRAGKPKRDKARRERTKLNQQRTLEQGAADVALASQYAPVLTSEAPVVISLAAVPSVLRPKGFTWTSLFKRDHCSPWRNGR